MKRQELEKKERPFAAQFDEVFGKLEPTVDEGKFHYRGVDVLLKDRSGKDFECTACGFRTGIQSLTIFRSTRKIREHITSKHGI
jgi:hypothetical protein